MNGMSLSLDVIVRSGKLWVGLMLAVGCTGPGLEPPNGNQSVAGSAGAAGRAGSGTSGMAAAGAGGRAGPPSGAPGLDAATMEPSNDAGATDAASDAAVDDDAGAPYASRELVGPTYMGSVSNGAECSKSYLSSGHEPAGSGGERYPLFLYFVGTAFVPGDPSAAVDNPAAMAVTEAMARRGFVALSVQYDNDAIAWLSDHVNQLACLFDGAKPESLATKACALPNVDCDLGIATWGHSQGGYVAAMAYTRERRVRAAWTTGYGGDAPSMLPLDRLRVVNGEADAGDNGSAARLMLITGWTPAECPDPDQCLREDGSGFIIVRRSELAMPETSTADHCWFDRPSCGAGMIVLEPNWVNRESDKAFALETNADWVAEAVRR